MMIGVTVRRGLRLAVLLIGGCVTGGDRPELGDLRMCVQDAALACGLEWLGCQTERERTCMAARGWVWVAGVGYVAVSETDDARRGREIEREGRL